jgi:hypothetical protein
VLPWARPLGDNPAISVDQKAARDLVASIENADNTRRGNRDRAFQGWSASLTAFQSVPSSNRARPKSVHMAIAKPFN